MKKVIFCQTPFQIIVALFVNRQIKKKNDQIDVVITNTFSGYEKFAERIKEKKIFHNVIIANAKDIIKSKTKKENISKMFYIFNLKKMMKHVFNQKVALYDEMYCWNYDAFTASFRCYLAKCKHAAKLFIYDEGYITYMPIDEVIPKRGFIKLIEKKNKITGLPKIVRENKDGMLLFEPDFLIYKPSCPIYQISRKVDNDFCKMIDYIFDASAVLKNYDRKYIIFEEAMLANCDDVDDFSLYKEIIEKLGPENVIVKLHPRTKEDRFSKLGVKVLGSDGVPWEAIMLAGQFNDKVLITIGSGSITNCLMIFGGNVESYMLFKIVKPNLPHFQGHYDELWNKIAKSSEKGGLHIPKTMDEFYSLLLKKNRRKLK